MKKLFSIVILMIISLSVLLSSCTEEEVTGPTDSSGQGERSNPPL